MCCWMIVSKWSVRLNIITISSCSTLLVYLCIFFLFLQIKVSYMHIFFCIPHRNTSLCRNLIFLLFITDLTLWLLSLLLVCGDIINPGQDSVDGNSSSSEELSSTSIELLNNHLSIIHANVPSLVPKIDIINRKNETYDVLDFTEI